MKLRYISSCSAILFGALVQSVPLSSPDFSSASNTGLFPRAPCAGNTASDRSVWCDNDINTNWYETTPDTGVVREYWFEITNTTASPDGFERLVMTVNGTIPGPAIFADWGDTVVVHVTNSLQNNGTGIHFHGIQQKGTFQSDGVPSITQCPVAPGDSITYTWRATQYGSSWYHSHFSMQAWNGVFGPIIINGPASANYDEDVGTVFLTDWAHITADAQESVSETAGPPRQDNGLINGKNTFNGDGERWETSFESGKIYRMRLVNSAVDTIYNFAIDGHTITVIAMDFVPIVPYNVTGALMINMGQRYDIVVTANQPVGDYWMRALPCGQITNTDGVKAIIRYDNSSTSDPTSTGLSATTNCAIDEAVSNLVPVVPQDVGDVASTANLAAAISRNSENLNRWRIGNTTMITDWSLPSIEKAYNNDYTFTDSEAVISLPNANVWEYLVITNGRVTHPIHLHGHDFFILAQGVGSATNATLDLTNPPRRDVATLPGSGYLIIAFYTDNPGIWLMHCHIGFHTFEGFGLQFVERQAEIGPLIDDGPLSETCNNWKAYAQREGIVQHESGI